MASGTSALAWAVYVCSESEKRYTRASDRENPDEDEGDEPDDEREYDNQDRERLRGRGNPGEVPPDVPLHVAAGEHVEGEHDRREDEHGPPRQIVRQRHEQALDDRDPERQLDPSLAKPAARPSASRLDNRLAVSHFSTVPRWCREPCAPSGRDPLLRCPGSIGVQKQAVDDRTRTADVGAKRAQPDQLFGEPRAGEIVPAARGRDHGGDSRPQAIRATQRGDVVYPRSPLRASKAAYTSPVDRFWTPVGSTSKTQ